jgi:predicted XRE-type DNA-binding protein
VTPNRVSDILQRKTHLFGIDTLVNMVTAVGLRVEIRVAAAV